MKTLGIICEYNPFHGGHEFHLKEAREKSGADFVICAMSGACVQRGDIAAADKWKRAEMALLGGADVVFELPALFAVRAAQDFSMGGVSLLSAAGAEAISFGSENEDLSALTALADSNNLVDSRIKTYLNQGFSYPRAVQSAYEGHDAIPENLDESPNMMLGAEYMRAIESLGADMRIIPIRRDREKFTSASEIRRLLLAGEKDSAFSHMPGYASALIADDVYNSFENVSQAALFTLRNMDAEYLKNVSGIGEGLENRVLSAAASCISLDELFFVIKTKRYAMARIRRAVLSAVLGITKELCEDYPAVPYLRILGFRRSAAPYLSELRGFSPVPVITKTADAAMNPCLALDIRAQDLSDLGVNKKPGRDFTTSPVII